MEAARLPVGDSLCAGVLLCLQSRQWATQADQGREPAAVAARDAVDWGGEAVVGSSADEEEVEGEAVGSGWGGFETRKPDSREPEADCSLGPVVG